MQSFNRRAVLVGVVSATTGRWLGPALAQQNAAPAAATAPAFGQGEVIKRARDLASAPFDPTIPPLPESIAALDFDAWRDIRFNSDKPLLGPPGGKREVPQPIGFGAT